MQKVYNITRHPTKPDQAADGVVDLPLHITDKIKELSTFVSTPLPSVSYLHARALEIVVLLQSYSEEVGINIVHVMCGGAPYFNGILDKVLISNGFVPCYPFTIRQSSVENGKNVFVYKHIGLVRTV